MAFSITTFQDQVAEIAKQKEALLLKQLNWLLGRGLLVIEEGPMQVLRRVDSDTIELQQEIEIKVKDAEYIEKLELENADLRKKVEAIEAAIKGASDDP